MSTVLCTADIEASEKGARLNPDMIAVEPPELIGGDISVTTADPSIVSGTAAAVRALQTPTARHLVGRAARCMRRRC